MMTERANLECPEARVTQKPSKKGLADLAGRTSEKNER